VTSVPVRGSYRPRESGLRERRPTPLPLPHMMTSTRPADADTDRLREALRQILEVARLGAWTRDFMSGEVWWSDEFRALLHIPPDERRRSTASSSAFIPTSGKTSAPGSRTPMNQVTTPNSASGSCARTAWYVASKRGCTSKPTGTASRSRPAARSRTSRSSMRSKRSCAVRPRI
jgi:hypothetical protein